MPHCPRSTSIVAYSQARNSLPNALCTMSCFLVLWNYCMEWQRNVKCQSSVWYINIILIFFARMIFDDQWSLYCLTCDNMIISVNDSQLFNQNNVQHVTYAIFVIIWWIIIIMVIMKSPYIQFLHDKTAQCTWCTVRLSHCRIWIKIQVSFFEHIWVIWLSIEAYTLSIQNWDTSQWNCW